MAISKRGRRGCLPSLLFALLFALSLLSPAAEIPFEWSGIDRVVAVADLHGDYDRFVFILTHPAVGLLDEDLRWAGGRTHFVQLGDVMDRGPDARKIFDLVMRIEKEAGAAGGMVHQLIGNHEELNITGIALDYQRYVTVEQFVSFLPDDFRVARDKEFLKTLPAQERKRAEEEGLDLASNEPYLKFWQRKLDRKDEEAVRAYIRGFNDGYGDWLIRKNTVIRINDVVFTHGGVSERLSKWPLREINDVMRAELGIFRSRAKGPQAPHRPFKPKLVYAPDSPLWFRGLASRSEESARAEVDRILANLNARAMVIGHNFGYQNIDSSSPIIDRKSVARFGEKVWIMDTGISDFYGGVPSALIYEMGAFEVWGETEEAAARTSPQLPETEALPRKEFEAFLSTASAKVTNMEAAGRTAPWIVALESGGTMRRAIFKYIDRRRPNDLPDSYRYELAAYALDKYLRLGFVPPVVEREIEGLKGSLQAFVENAVRESDRKEKKIAPKDPPAFERAMADLRIFESLTYDDCRNENDVYVGRDDDKVQKVDFSEAFAPREDTVPHCDILKCSRLIYKKLLAWDDETVAGIMRPYLNEAEIRALNVRRTLVVRVIRKLIEVRGEKNVFI
jgi:hypothetical protein